MSNNSYTYCKKWFLAKKRPIDIWAESKAKIAHDAQLEYTVLIGSDVSPSAAITVSGNKKFVSIQVFDKKLRAIKTAHFKEFDGEKLYLSMITNREYDLVTDKVLSGKTYIYKPNGIMVIRDSGFDPDSFSEYEVEGINLEENTCLFPNFGEYKSLLEKLSELIGHPS